MDWRLILDLPHPGAWNMARDEALLDCAAAPDFVPTLRFYDWNPPCVSLGRFQQLRIDKFTQSAVQNPQSTIETVRRPTGGRAVLHQHEITYAAVLREDHLPPGASSVVGAYRYLSQGFILGLREWGVEAALAAGRSGHGAANCFSSSAQCDFVVDARKLVGAAQCRRRGAILQHGSLLLNTDPDLWHNLLGGNMTQVVTLRELGVTGGRDQIIASLCRGVEQALGACLVSGDFTQQEIGVACRLHKQKYSTREWNQSGHEPASEADE